MRPLACVLVAVLCGCAVPALAAGPVPAGVPTTSAEPSQGIDPERLPDGIEGENGAVITGGPFDYEWEDGHPLALGTGWFLLGTLTTGTGLDAALALLVLTTPHPEIRVIR